MSPLIMHAQRVCDRYHISRYLPYFLMILILTIGGYTYLGIQRQSLAQQGFSLNLTLFYLPLALLLVFLIILINKFVKLWVSHKKGLSGSKLHSQMLALFAAASIIPGLLIAIFASVFFKLGVQAWFGEPVKTALRESSAVIQAYVQEHERNLALEAVRIGELIQPKLEALKYNRDAFDAELTAIEEKLSFSECLVITKNEQILGKSQLTFALEMGRLSAEDFRQAEMQGWTTRLDTNRLRALILLDPQDQIYLFIGRPVDTQILKHIEHNTEAVSLYSSMENERTAVEVNFLILFVVLTLLLLFAAMWVGLGIANRMMHPIGNLIDAAQAVSQGDLNAQVKTEHLNNELDMLIHSFNTMVSQLNVQQKELIMSQKKAAWTDIARKIAHEIKNPLTPIQLSAERLKRRYLQHVAEPTIFEQCIDTIIRQVGHIGNLVQEFSNFARMPEAKMDDHDIIAILRSALILESSGRNIRFEERITEDELFLLCDSQQISQVFMNLLQNSIDALIENDIQNATIRVQLFKEKGQIIIRIEDNGPGFSSLDTDRIMEPYFTTRKKGTGLGLAIVQKIVTDHAGSIHLGSSPMGGAMVTLIFQTKDN